MRIDSDVRANLLELMQMEAQAKEALTEAITEVADRLEVDKGVLKKVIAAEFKDQTWKLRAAAQMTLDLLDDGQPRLPARASDAQRRSLHRQADQLIADMENAH